MDPEQKRRNELDAIRVILMDKPNDSYWLERLAELEGFASDAERTSYYFARARCHLYEFPRLSDIALALSRGESL